MSKSDERRAHTEDEEFDDDVETKSDGDSS